MAMDKLTDPSGAESGPNIHFLLQSASRDERMPTVAKDLLAIRTSALVPNA